MSRIYVVTDLKHDGQDSLLSQKFLVDADSQHQAIGVVVADRYEAKAANTMEVVELMSTGVKVMKAKKLVQEDLPEIEPAPV